MNSKAIIATAILMVAAFSGVALMSETDAEDTGYSVAYMVDGKTYTVPQVAGEGVTPGTVTLATLVSLGATAPVNKTFTSWNTMADGSGTAYTAGSTLIIPNVVKDGKTATLYAQFDWTVYTAKFIASDGTLITSIEGTANPTPDASKKELGNVDLSKKAPSAPAIDGKIFAGWLADGAEKAIMTKDLGKLEADVTYTATYVIDYKVTFIDGDKTYISKVSDLTVPDLGERTGFTFLGWYMDVDGEPVQVLNPKTFAYIADTTLTAKWEPMNVYVTFIAGSFETTVAVLYGQTVVVPELPEGFTGWDFDFATPITKDTTVYAVEAEPAEPSGMSNPVTMTLVIIVGALVLAGVAGLIVLQRKGKIVIGRGPNAKKPEEPKE